MVGFPDEPGHLPTSRQALKQTPWFFPMVLLAILLASVAAGSVSAQENAACNQYGCAGAACDQYGCAEESAACDQYGCTGDSAPEEPVSEGRLGPTGAGTSAVEPVPQIESIAPTEENGSVIVPPAVYKGVEGNAPASEQYAEEHETLPQPEPDPVASGTKPVETEAESDPSSKSGGQSTDVRRSGSKGEIDDGDNPDEQATEPLPGYHYKGKACEESNCGLEEIEAPVECATYETASGKEVYGCSNPNTYEKRGCFEVTFYTEEGEPYSNLDTCSGEKPYAPPEPPEGDFEYWEPPENLYSGDSGRPWRQWTDSCHKNNRPNGLPVGHCDIEGYPKKGWECEWFYDTQFGTVRGCYSWKNTSYENGFCSGRVRVYDEVGRPLGTFTDCRAPRQGPLCGKNNCSIKRNLSEEWTCSRYSQEIGTLYGQPEQLQWTECLNWEHHNKFVESDKKEDAKRRCVWWFDEDGRPIGHEVCGRQGDVDVFDYAERDANDADETLNGGDDLNSPAGGSSTPYTDAWGSDHFGREQASEPHTSFASDAVSSKPGRSGDGIPLSTDISDPSVAAPDQDAVGVNAILDSSLADSHSVDSGSSGADTSPTPVSENSDPANDSLNSASSSSPADEARVLTIERHTSEEKSGRTNNGSSPSEPSRNVSAGSDGSAQDEMTKDARWPGFAYEIRDAVASLTRADGVGGWLGTVTPLAGLGAVAGVFVLRRRFLR